MKDRAYTPARGGTDISVELDPKVWKRLDELARAQNKSRAAICRPIITEFVNRVSINQDAPGDRA